MTDIITSNGSEIFLFNPLLRKYVRDEVWDTLISKDFNAAEISKSSERLSWIRAIPVRPHDERNLYYLLSESSLAFLNEVEKIKSELKKSGGIDMNFALCRRSNELAFSR